MESFPILCLIFWSEVICAGPHGSWSDLFHGLTALVSLILTGLDWPFIPLFFPSKLINNMLNKGSENLSNHILMPCQLNRTYNSIMVVSIYIYFFFVFSRRKKLAHNLYFNPFAKIRGQKIIVALPVEDPYYNAKFSAVIVLSNYNCLSCI